MRYFYFFLFFLLLTKSYATPVILDLGNYQIEMDALISINVDKKITIKKDGNIIDLTQERYEGLKVLLDNIYDIKTETGIEIVRAVHPFAIEEFEFLINKFPIRQEVLDYWNLKYQDPNFNLNDSSLWPNVKPISMEFWNFWWNRTNEYEKENKIYLDFQGNQIIKNVYIVPDIIYVSIDEFFK